MSHPLLEKGEHDKLVAMLLNPNKPAETRAKMLVTLFHGAEVGPEVQVALVTTLLSQMVDAGQVAEAKEIKDRYLQAIKELETGTARPATFIEQAEGNMPGPKPRAHVVSPDGQERFPALHPDLKIEDLSAGMTVYLDPAGAVVLGTSQWVPPVGPQATFVRRIDGTKQVEAKIRDEEVLLYATRKVLEAVEDGTLVRGDRLLICPQRQFAFGIVPADDDRRHRFVDSGKIPNILPGRDIGNPHPCLGWLVRRTRLLMFRPDIIEKFDIRPRASLLMTGPSGTGKTLTIKGYLTLFYQMLQERTGRDPESRVVRVKMSEQLSEWLGRSDKNFDQLFQDILELASKEVVLGNGERALLPVVVIMEEVEGIARRRGDHDGSGGAYDRIMGTLLQRLDDPLDDLARVPLVLISTTNKPSLVDVAMYRRLGAQVARFKRLDREGLSAILDKKVKPSYAFASNNGHSRGELRQQLIDEVVAHLFSPHNDGAGQLEITFRDGAKQVKHARDFLTGAVVEQAVADCLDRLAFFAEKSERDDVGLTSDCLIDSLRRQTEALIDNVTAYNAEDYVDLPEHALVASVRRLRGANCHAVRQAAGGRT